MVVTRSKIPNLKPKIGALLPIAFILLAAIPATLYLLFADNFGREQLAAPYRYPYQRQSPGSIATALQREIAFYRERILYAPQDGLNRAFLATAYLKMARATGEASWYLLAEQSAEQSLAKLPFHNDGSIIALARIALAKHDFNSALRLAEQVDKNDEALSISVTANLAIGKTSEALSAANTLVDKTPTLNSLTLRALVQVALGKDGEAIRDFQQALAVEEPNETGSSVWTRTLLGRFYFKRGKIELARQLYEEALRVLPQYPPALLNLAELEIRSGNYRSAERYYSQIFLTSQRSGSVYDLIVMRGMARVKDLSGDRTKAKEWRDRSEAQLRQDITGFGHRRELARLLLEKGSAEDVREALSLMEMEVRSRRDPETLDTLAMAYAQQGKWREAQQAMQEALRSGIREAEFFHRAGTIEQALGNRTKAIYFFQRASETDPTFDQNAQQALGLGV